MYEFLKNLDRRWIFLMMLLAVAIPILLELKFPEKPTGLAQAVFDEIDKLPEGAPVLLAFDFDPASEGELGPMATAFTFHCATKKLKMYYMTLWPVGPRMIEDCIAKVIKPDFPDMKYGEDWVNLGYKSGYEGVIKVIVTDLKQLYTTDHFGAAIDSIPMMQNIQSVQDFDLVINCSAGYAGTKEWVQYASTPFPEQIRIVAGCTGVQSPLLYPYIPNQLPGLLGAIKGAAEYEKLVMDKYVRAFDREPDPKYLEGIRRMGPQLVAHLLMIFFIIVGNWVYFTGKKREAQS
ncbi:MAG: hypothetical protein O7G85_12540 [Planctomycetota bacterium]|nr:hypothetical protein [Planctomycetota bacterium]